MIVNNILSRVLLGILTGCCLLACRGELPVLPSDEIDVGKDPLGGVSIKGMYLLNEGNMGSNKVISVRLIFMTALPVSIIVIFMPSGIRP